MDEENHDYEDEEDEEDEELDRSINPRVDDSSELILAITKPIVDSRFDKYVSRDLAVGNIPDIETVDIVRRYISLINDFIFLKMNNLANVYNVDLKAFLNALRSLKGFERKQETTITKIKSGITGEQQQKGRWGLKK